MSIEARDWALRVHEANARAQARQGERDPDLMLVAVDEEARLRVAVALLPTLPAAERLRLGKPPTRREGER